MGVQEEERHFLALSLKTQTNLEQSVLIQLGARYHGREMIQVKTQWLHHILKINIYIECVC